jgi:enoyl-CoA hydratase/carnithine racemase
MADYKNISLEVHPETKIAKLTLRRPEKLNAISHEMGLELVDAIEKVSNNEDARS